VNGNADDAQKRMLLALLTSLRGTSFVYQGEELGLTEATVPFEKIKDPFGLNFWPEDIGRDGCRTPIPWVKGAKNSGFTAAAEPWLPIPAEHDAASVDVQEKDAGSHLHFARNFIHWRKNHPALATGNMTFIDMPHPLLAFRRHADAEDMLCVFNLGTTEVEGELPFAVEPVDGHGFNAQLDGQKIKLPAFGVFYGRKK
jgi:alpha-glucosidase